MFPVKSYVSPKIAVRQSKIHGLGMFAATAIEKDEIVFIKGGHIVTRNELFASETINSYLPIDDDFYMGALCYEEETYVKLFINHSCEPNCGLRGEITFVAMREILEGEELVCDYSMIDNEDYAFDCTCRTEKCRRRITGFDWKLSELQDRYGGYFARYLLDKMNRR